MFGISDISQVCYYPAAGTDIQAILRFSHLTDTILAPTASRYLTRERQARLFADKCEALNRFYGKPLLELIDVVDLDHHFASEPKYVKGPIDIFTKAGQIAYMKAFMPQVPERLSATRFVFRRRIGRIERKIEWIHTSTEGLATLEILYRRTGMLPGFFCTIQTGCMEYPQSPLIRLFEKIGQYPQIWVRGFWPKKAWSRAPIWQFPPYDCVAQDYGYWNSSFGITTLSHEDNSSMFTPRHSCVRAFTREPLQLPLTSRAMTSRLNPERRVMVEYGSILNHADRFDGSIVSAHMCNAGQQVNTRKATTWEALSLRDPGSLFPTMTLLEALETAGDYARKEGIQHLAVTPMGYEDEGESIQEYLDASDAPVDITVFGIRPLDFIGLADTKWKAPGSRERLGA